MRWLLASLLALTLGGCGFYMQGSSLGRGTPLKRVYIKYPGGPSLPRPLLVTLRRDLQGRGVTVVDAPTEATAVLHIYSVGGPSLNVAINNEGYSQRHVLIQRVRFELTRHGKRVVGPMTLTRSQEYAYTATTRLATSQERDKLERALQRELAQDVLERIDLQLHQAARTAASPKT